MSPRPRREGKSAPFKTKGPPGLCPRKRLEAILTVLLRYPLPNARFKRFSSFGP
jgi:hypothetical protein